MSEEYRWQIDFVKQVLPVVEKHAEIQFRSLRPSDREDNIAEAVAHAFVAFVSLRERGKQDVSPNVLADFAVKHVREDRRAAGGTDAKCAMNRRAKWRTGHTVSNGADWLEAATPDHGKTPVPDRAAFRIDFRRWMHCLGNRSRAIAAKLAQGFCTSEVAEMFGVSPGRISQIRRELEHNWKSLGGDGEAA